MITVSTRIPEGMDKQLSAIAKATDRKKSYLVRRALEEYINTKTKAISVTAKSTTKKKKAAKKSRVETDPFYALSYEKLAEIWDNDEDAVYDHL